MNAIASALPEAAAPTLPAVTSEQGFDDGPGRDARFGSLIAGVFFLGFGGFAAFAPLQSAVHAEGQVVVAQYRQAVQHPDGGVVSRLIVRENEQVVRGQVLVEVADTELVAAVRALTSTVTGLQAQRARLLAERDQAAAMTLPAEFESLGAEAAVFAREAAVEQTHLFQQRARARQAEAVVLMQRVAQLEQQKKGAELQHVATIEQLRIVGEEIAVQQTLLEKGLALAPRLRALERDQARLQGELGEISSVASRTVEAMGETRLTLQSRDQTFRAEVAEQLRDTDLKLGELLPQLASAKAKLERAQIRAPTSGRVAGLSVFTEGGVIGAGQSLMEIIPDAGGFVIEARASPNDADDLGPGLKAEVRFSGLPTRGTSLVLGEVSNVSADRLVDERTGEAYYRVEVQVSREELMQLEASLDRSGLVRPGIPAEIIIPLRERTLLSYIAEPLTDSLWRSFRED
jgi:HlyD family type I secretion membrane fusion protein